MRLLAKTIKPSRVPIRAPARGPVTGIVGTIDDKAAAGKKIKHFNKNKIIIIMVSFTSIFFFICHTH